MRALERDHRVEEEFIDSEGTWAISYGDMITLLLSFFVLYFTVDHDATQTEKLNESLVFSLSTLVQETKSDAAKSPTLNIGDTEGSNVDKTVMENLGAKIYEVGKIVIVEFPGTSFYKLGKIKVNKEGRKTLAQFAQLYLPYAGKYTLGIRAFTDTRPVIQIPGRRFKDNLELSALRSVAAMRVLQTKGIPLTRMKLGGFGELPVSAKELKAAGIDFDKRDPRSMARKVMLVIEPALKKGEDL